MAFNSSPVWKVTFTLRDQDRVSYSSFYIRRQTGLSFLDIKDASFETFLAEFASSLTNLTECYVEGYSLSTEWLNDAPRTFGAAADVERKAVLQFKTASGFYSIFTIPGAKYDMFNPNDGETIISTSSVLGDFVDNPLQTHLESVHDKLVNGATVATVTYPATDRRSDDITQIWDAYKQHRSNPRG